MRNLTMATLFGAVIVVSVPVALADGDRVSSPASSSDAVLLADRHLALYRAAQVPAAALRDAGYNDGESAPAIVRTSATAAIPLPPRTPAPREADGQ